MVSIKQHLATVHQQITEAENSFGREPDSVQLLAVSKTRSVDEICQARQAGQVAFGENYIQEALEKIGLLQRESIEWHFIGRIQSNKTKLLAEHFDWVHTIDNLKHAQRLNNQRPGQLAPLKVCLQVNISGEESKGGFNPEEMASVISAFDALPRLKLCGLMVIPAPARSFDEQRQPFHYLRQLRDKLATKTYPLETLSMGMSGDLEAAIAEGANMVRVGTAIFGSRATR